MLIIIFGTRGITSTKEEGDFYCPTCDGDREYAQKRVRRFFTLYFIPLIPLNVVGEYVECRGCEGTFSTEVLGYSPEEAREAFEAAFHVATRQILVKMALADRQVTPDELETVRDIYRQVTGDALGEAEVDREIERARSDGRSVAEYLEDVVYHLNDHGKEMVLQAAFAVASADGDFGDEEQRLLGDIGQALEMSPSHVRGALSAMTTAG